MFRTAMITLLVGATGVGALFFIQTPPEQKTQQSLRVDLPQTSSDQKISLGQNALSQFQNVHWNDSLQQESRDSEIFNIFSPLAKTQSTFLLIPVTSPTKQKIFSLPLPQNILAIGPLKSLARFMDGTTAPASGNTTTGTNDCPPGLDENGGRHLPESHNNGEATGYGSIRDEYFVNRYLNDQSIGEPALLGTDPQGLLLPESDPRIQALANQYSASHGGATRAVPNILRLNPDACYMSARWAYANAQNSRQAGTDSSSLYHNEAARVILTSNTGDSFVCIPIDWGPGYNENSSDFDIPYALLDKYGSSGWGVKLAPNQNAPQGACDGVAAIHDTGAQGSGSGGISTVGPYNGSVSGGASFAFCGDDHWSDQDICCYKHTGPAGGPNQYDGVQTCNAGYIMSGGKHPTPIRIDNCGKEGALCDRALSIAQGGPLLSCLFTACQPGRNAIWDPQTKRCGCDDGLGGSKFATSFNGLNQPIENIEGDESSESVDGGPDGQNGTPGKPGTMAEKVTLLQPNDKAGFPTGAIVRSDGTIVPIDQHLYDDLQKLSEKGFSPEVTSMVGNHDQLVSGSTNESRHWTGHAMDLNVTDNRAQLEYLYTNREALGIRQIISGQYPDLNYDSQGRTFSQGLLNQHMSHAHIGH